jgi:hypothetical protein
VVDVVVVVVGRTVVVVVGRTVVVVVGRTVVVVVGRTVVVVVGRTVVVVVGRTVVVVVGRTVVGVVEPDPRRGAPIAGRRGWQAAAVTAASPATSARRRSWRTADSADPPDCSLSFATLPPADSDTSVLPPGCWKVLR